MNRLSRCALAALAIVALSTPIAAHAASRSWPAPDFFIDDMSAHRMWAHQHRPRATNCRAHIKEAMCVNEGRSLSKDHSSRLSCSSDSETYVQFFEAVYDRLPGVLQKVFCSIDTISVEADLESIAYAGMGMGGTVMGFRKSVIDEDLDLTTLLSWKEQLVFGGRNDDYSLDPELPQLMVTSPSKPAEDLAFYVLVHEFGHLLDFANNINTNCWGGDCDADAATWTALSWASSSRANRAGDFPLRSDVCFYGCGGKRPLTKSDVPKLYRGLDKSNFITLYAATNIYDDFAESLAFYYLEKDGKFDYNLDTQQGKTMDLLSKVNSHRFASKRDYIKHFVQRDDIAYP